MLRLHFPEIRFIPYTYCILNLKNETWQAAIPE
jgi:hypothetical protein